MLKLFWGVAESTPWYKPTSRGQHCITQQDDLPVSQKYAGALLAGRLLPIVQQVILTWAASKEESSPNKNTNLVVTIPFSQERMKQQHVTQSDTYHDK